MEIDSVGLFVDGIFLCGGGFRRGGNGDAGTQQYAEKTVVRAEIFSPKNCLSACAVQVDVLRMKHFISSIYAGAMIAFGGVVFLCCAGLENGKVIGAFLFSLGLLTVVARGFALYTGKIGYLDFSSPTPKTPPTNFRQSPMYFPIVIAGNFVGTALVALALRSTRSFNGLQPVLDSMCAAKLSDSPLSVFLLACGCGIMMFLAVDNFRKTKSWLFVILPVMVFILCGFEHCVANMFYFWAADCWSVKTFGYLGVMILGNGVGAYLFRRLSQKI